MSDSLASDAVDLSIVIPAYNEEDRIAPFLDEVAGWAHDSALRVEVLVVDDGSTDATVPVVEEFRARFVSLWGRASSPESREGRCSALRSARGERCCQGLSGC